MGVAADCAGTVETPLAGLLHWAAGGVVSMPMVARASERVPVPVLAHQIRGEYEEMPCLRLTLPQASRFWNVDAETCRAVLEQLVADGFLVLGRFGYMRPQTS